MRCGSQLGPTRPGDAPLTELTGGSGRVSLLGEKADDDGPDLGTAGAGQRVGAVGITSHDLQAPRGRLGGRRIELWGRLGRTIPVPLGVMNRTGAISLAANGSTSWPWAVRSADRLTTPATGGPIAGAAINEALAPWEAPASRTVRTPQLAQLGGGLDHVPSRVRGGVIVVDQSPEAAGGEGLGEREPAAQVLVALVGDHHPSRPVPSTAAWLPPPRSISCAELG
jgi:hypothetical protein